MFRPIFEYPVVQSRRMVSTIAHNQHGMVEVCLVTVIITIDTTCVVLK